MSPKQLDFQTSESIQNWNTLQLQASARLRGVDSEFSKVCCFIDGWNLPKNCGLQLEQVLEDDRMVLLEAHKQYRLKSSEGFKSQVCTLLSHFFVYIYVFSNYSPVFTEPEESNCFSTYNF